MFLSVCRGTLLALARRTAHALSCAENPMNRFNSTDGRTVDSARRSVKESFDIFGTRDSRRKQARGMDCAQNVPFTTNPSWTLQKRASVHLYTGSHFSLIAYRSANASILAGTNSGSSVSLSTTKVSRSTLSLLFDGQFIEVGGTGTGLSRLSPSHEECTHYLSFGRGGSDQRIASILRCVPTLPCAASRFLY